MQTDLARTQRRGLLARIRASDDGLAISSPFARFLLVGAIAYAINQLALLFFYDLLPALPDKDTEARLLVFTHPDIRLLIATALAVEMAIVFKFYANENWTFSERQRHGWFGARLVTFNASCLVSAAITIGAVNVLTPVFGLNPYIANTIGTFFGFTANYIVSAYLIWPHRTAANAAGER